MTSKNNISPKHTACILLGLMTFAMLIRLLIIFNSGELLHMDGQEYFDFAQHVRASLVAGDWQAAFNIPVIGHWGCILFEVIPLSLRLSWLSDREASAIFFSLPAIINIYLMYRVTRRFGSTRYTALIAATLYTVSFSALYHVRYVHPHNLAIMFFLLGAIVTLKNPSRPYRMPLAGTLYFLCFFTYYGYWILALLGMLFVTFYRARSLPNLISHGFLASAGFFTPLLAFLLLGHHYGADYFRHFEVFSNTITMGDFSLGHAVPWLFFWHAEGVLSLLWLASLLFAFRHANEPAVKYCLAGIGLMYALFIVCSNWLEQFVVYGRLAKAMVPMLCIITAFALSRVQPWKLLLITTALLPGYLFNAWQIHRVALWTDVAVHKGHFIRQLGENNDILVSAECKLPHPACQEHAHKGCIELWRFLPADALAFNAYDSQTKQSLELLKHIEHGTILACPKASPESHP